MSWPGFFTEAGPVTGDGPMSVANCVGLNGVPTALGLHEAVSAGVLPSLVARAGTAATDSISAEDTPTATTRLTFFNSSSFSVRQQRGRKSPHCSSLSFSYHHYNHTLNRMRSKYYFMEKQDKRNCLLIVQSVILFLGGEIRTRHLIEEEVNTVRGREGLLRRTIPLRLAGSGGSPGTPLGPGA